MTWFRMYAEFANDPDVQSMAFEDQRHYVVILCMKCAATLDKEYPTPERRYAVIRKTLGLDNLAIDECKRRLMEAGLIDHHWQPIAWDRRQFVSDNSTNRVQAFRERQRNVSETPSEAETDTEAEKRGSAGALAPPKPRPSKRVPQEFQVSADLMAWAAEKCPSVDVRAETEKFRDHTFRDAKVDWPATWRQWMRRAFEMGDSRGTNQRPNKARLSAVERVYKATAHLVGDSGRVGVALDGGVVRSGVSNGVRGEPEPDLVGGDRGLERRGVP